MLNYLEEGNKKLESKDYEGALEDFNTAIEIDSESKEAYVGKGKAKEGLKKYEEALEAYNKAIEIDPTDAYAHTNIGLVKEELKDYAGALEAYNKAIEIDPTYAYAHTNIGLVKEALKDYAGALEAFNKAIENDPTDAYSYTNIGRIKKDLKDYAGAIEAFNKAIEVDPTYAYTYDNIGLVKEDLKDYAGALEAFNKAIENDPTDAYAYTNIGRIKKDLKDYAGALEAFNKAIEVDPTYAYAYDNIGIIKKALKDYAGALEAFNKAIEVDPTYVYAYDNIGRIKKELNKPIQDKTNITDNLAILNTIVDENIKCEEGFLTFADILGWKGIWQKKEFEPERALTKLISIKNKLQALDSKNKLKINLISDTFVIFCMDISLQNKACKLLIESCLEEGLLIRGAVSYGEHYNKETVYVGPAVDEAASWHEKAEEVAIFYTTSARLKADELIRKELKNSKEEEILNKYNLEKREIISKQGRIKTYSISWKTPNNRTLFYDIMLKNQIYPELYSKYINTEDYLRENK